MMAPELRAPVAQAGPSSHGGTRAAHASRAGAIARLCERMLGQDEMIAAKREPGDPRYGGTGVTATLRRQPHGFSLAAEHYVIENGMRLDVLRAGKSFSRMEEVVSYLAALGFSMHEIGAAAPAAQASTEPLVPFANGPILVAPDELVGMGVGLLRRTHAENEAGAKASEPAVQRPEPRHPSMPARSKRRLATSDEELFEGALRAFEAHLEQRIDRALDALEENAKQIGKRLAWLEGRVQMHHPEPPDAPSAPRWTLERKVHLLRRRKLHRP